MLGGIPTMGQNGKNRLIKPSADYEVDLWPLAEYEVGLGLTIESAQGRLCSQSKADSIVGLWSTLCDVGLWPTQKLTEGRLCS